MKYTFLALALLLAYSGRAQHNRSFITPPTARVLPGAKPPVDSGLRLHPTLYYPALALRLGMEGVVWMSYSVGTDGRVREVAFDRLDSLVVSTQDQQEIARFAQTARQELIDAAHKSINALRLAPADSVRAYEAAFTYRIGGYSRTAVVVRPRR